MPSVLGAHAERLKARFPCQHAPTGIDNPPVNPERFLLKAGQRLGAYEIVSLLGTGGMGQVWKARDPALKRDVAIKTLPVRFSNDPERLRRFEQEAQAAGRLNHPNVLTVYAVGQENGFPYLVTELLEGATLRSRLIGQPIAAAKALDYACQIAQGLAAAHDKGIVHHDIKPENVFITATGLVKILDFGLAKLIEPRSGLANPFDQETRLTASGMIMGTPAYMSPEQIRGERSDSRSDIFSLGVILYEMLAGAPLFSRENAVETMSAVLKQEPLKLSHVAAPVERLIKRCLEKNPSARFQSAGDLAFAISALVDSAGSDLERTNAAEGKKPELRVGRSPRRFLWMFATSVFLLTTLGFGWLYVHRPSDVGPTIRFSIAPPDGKGFVRHHDVPFSAAVSPDGSRLALIVTTDGRSQLWVRSLNSAMAQPLEGTEGAGYPFWSPDSRYIGFFSEGKLKKIQASGGSPVTICDAARWSTSAAWSAQDVILFSSPGAGINRVPAEGGKPILITKRVDALWPNFLPDGRHFLFFAGWNLYVGTLDSTDVQLLLKDASRAMYAAPGYLLYVREGSLMAQRFDAQALRFSGEPILIADGLWFFKQTGMADFSISENGVLVYKLGRSVSQLKWLDRSGAEMESIDAPNDYELPRISPNGKSVAVHVTNSRTGTSDVWIYDLSRHNHTLFTAEPGQENGPIWSPDGSRIVFASDQDGPPHLFQKMISGGRQDELAPRSGWVQWPYDWTKNGQFIVYGDGQAATGEDLMVLPLSDGKPRPYLRTRFNETDARISPDGRWVAYVSDKTGRAEIYVSPLDNPSDSIEWLVSTTGGAGPRWGRDGKELFYIAPDQNLMSAAVRAGTTFESGKPVPLFRTKLRDNQYDVSADGQRFLMNVAVTQDHLMPLTTVINWTRDLQGK
jgi:eukaryotic-like serine/threonine-protein kinase